MTTSNPQIDSTESFVQASKLSHLRFKNGAHLWQVLNGKIKSFINTPQIVMIEKLLGFEEDSFWEMMKQHQEGNLLDGFYWADHETQRANYYPGKIWKQECEDYLAAAGLIIAIRG